MKNYISPLIAILFSFAASAEELPRSKVIGIKCPNENRGVLELLRKRIDGARGRARYTYKNNSVIYVLSEGADRGNPYEIIKSINMRDTLTKEDNEYAERAIKTVTPVFENVCNGTYETKKLYYDIVEKNKKDLEYIE